MVAEFARREVTVIEIPVGFPVIGGLRLSQGQKGFAKIRAYAGVDELDLAGLALEGGV